MYLVSYTKKKKIIKIKIAFNKYFNYTYYTSYLIAISCKTWNSKYVYFIK